MKVLVLHTLPPEACAAGRSTDELDLSAAARGVADVLPGAVLAGVRGEPAEVIGQIEAHAPDVVFNACEAPLGRPDLEAHVAALFEWLGVRFIGSGSETLALCRRKDRTNAVLAAQGVPVPRTGVFPCIVKPADEDGSAGIDSDSVCTDAGALERARVRLRGPVVIQEFLPGREFAVYLWGCREPDFDSIGEMTFKNGLRLNTYASKWAVDSDDFANSPIDYEAEIDVRLREAILCAARSAWRAVGIRGYCKVDVRLDAAGQPCVLEVNPNPEIGPGAGAHRAAEEAGWTWEQFVRKQIEWA